MMPPGIGAQRGERPQVKSSSAAWRDNRPGTSSRTEAARPSRGRGGNNARSPPHHEGPERGGHPPATSSPSGGNRSSRPGKTTTADVLSESSTSRGKRKPSSRSSDQAARRRVTSSRKSSSSSSSSTPGRPSPLPARSQGGPTEQEKDCLRSLLARWEDTDRRGDRRPSSKSRTSPPSGGASRRPLPRESRGGKDCPGHSRGEGTKRK